jgi:protein-glutamine gamma-glutamyltransferase
MSLARLWSLRLRDGSALCAYASMAISGELPVLVSGVFAVCAGLGLFGIRPLARLGKSSLAFLVLAAVVLFGAVFRGGLDLVIAAASFAALLTSHRMASEPTPETDDQILLVGILMVAGGASLSGDLLYAAALALFGVGACLARGLSLIHDVSGGEIIPLRPVVTQLWKGSAVALLGAAIFFVVFPRLSWNVAARSTPSGLGRATTGMSNGVRLGGSGEVKSNPRPVFRAALKPDPGVENLEAYWVAKTLERFDGKAWTGNGPLGDLRVRLYWGEPKNDRQVLKQEIELLPALGGQTVPMLERPFAAGHAKELLRSGEQPILVQQIRDVEVRFPKEVVAARITVLSAIEPDGATGDLPSGDVARFTELPASVDPRIAELARSIVGAERRPLQAASLLQRYLTAKYDYTLELDGDVPDALAHFLFVRKAGHCEYFATALAVMLRTLGIGSRVATGFYGGERVDDRYVIRAGDAHAWTQVLVPGVGFITVDATPEQNRSSQGSWVLAAAMRAYETVDGWWRNKVLDYSIFDQARLVTSFSMPRASVGEKAPQLPGGSRAWGALGAGVLVGLIAWRIGSRKSGPSRHDAAELLTAIERALIAARIPGAGQSPTEELLKGLPADTHPVVAPAKVAMETYLHARFGGAPLDTSTRRTLVRDVSQASRVAR